MWNSETTQNLDTYLYSYQKETAIFLAARHEKTIMACSYLNFFQYFLYFKLLVQQYYKNESIHLNSWDHSHKEHKDSRETQVVFVDIFA